MLWIVVFEVLHFQQLVTTKMTGASAKPPTTFKYDRRQTEKIRHCTPNSQMSS